MPVPATPTPVPQGQPVLVTNTNKYIFLTLGMILIAGSACVQAYSYYNYDVYKDVYAQDIFKGSYATLSLGLVLTLVGALYNPKIEFR